ncbi:hypothetical protein ACS0TY_003222 [Phlomoides rotata]
MFLGGLKPSTRERISESETRDVHAAIRAGRLITRSQGQSTSYSRPAFSPGGYSRPPTPYRDTGQQPSNPSQSQDSSAGSSTPSTARNIRHLTAEQAREYREKGSVISAASRMGPCINVRLNS